MFPSTIFSPLSISTSNKIGRFLRILADFHEAVARGDDIAPLLREDSWIVNSKNADGLTALHLAVKNRHEQVVQRLIEGGANVDAATTKSEGTPLMLAASMGNLGMVRILLECNANLDVRAINGTTAIFNAAYFRKMEVVQVLLEAGADNADAVTSTAHTGICSTEAATSGAAN